jgi:hypothetical protein
MDEARRLQLRRFAQMTPEERLRVGAGLSSLWLRQRRERECRARFTKPPNHRTDAPT